jgi:hypothetical protein
MNSSDVARVTRWLRGVFTRRTLFGGSVFTLSLLPRPGRGAQMPQLACGVAGDVCTFLHGCCDGFTCATSRINTAFGLCVAATEDSTSGDAATSDRTADRQTRRQDKRARLAERKDRKHDAMVQRRASERTDAAMHLLRRRIQSRRIQQIKVLISSSKC